MLGRRKTAGTPASPEAIDPMAIRRLLLAIIQNRSRRPRSHRSGKTNHRLISVQVAGPNNLRIRRESGIGGRRLSDIVAH
jgi:hypothetical protein